MILGTTSIPRCSNKGAKTTTYTVIAALALTLMYKPGIALEVTDTNTDQFYELDPEFSLALESLAQPENRATLSTLELAVSSELRLTESYAGYFEILATAEYLALETDPDTRTDFLELSEFWIGWSWENQNTTQLWIGRRELEDSIGWWWGENVNGLGLLISDSAEQPGLELALIETTQAWTSQPQPDDPEEDSIFHLLGTYHQPLPGGAAVSSFVAVQRDQSATFKSGDLVSETDFDESDSNLIWAGVRYRRTTSITNVGKFSALVDAAYMTGNEVRSLLIEEGEDEDESDTAAEDEVDPAPQKGQQVDRTVRESLSGWGTNLQLTWNPSFSSHSAVHIGYAYGSGTDRSQRLGSNTFRQTGLQSNESDTSYYGHLSDPELSNLQVLTALITHRFEENSGLFLQYNWYQRASRYDDTIEFDLDLDIANNHKDIGSEATIGLKHQFSGGLLAELTLSRFNPGTAVAPTAKNIDQYEFTIKYEY